MDPTILGLHKELHSILDASSKLAEENTKFTAIEESDRVTQLQRRMGDLFANEAFKKHCSANVQESLKESFGTLTGSFHTSSSHVKVVLACDAIRYHVRSILFPKESQAESSQTSTKHTKETVERCLSGSMAHGLVRLKTLILTGTPFTPETEEMLEKEPECKELLLIRREALKRLAEQTNIDDAKNLKERANLPDFTDALYPLTAFYAVDLEHILRTPKLRIQFYRLISEVKKERIYNRSVEFQKEFSSLMSEYEKLIGENESTICTRLEKEMADVTSQTPEETPAVRELRIRATNLLNDETFREHARNYNPSPRRAPAHFFDLIVGIPDIAYWPLSCYRNINALKLQQYDMLIDRLLAAVSRNDVADFRHRMTAVPIQDKRALEVLFLEMFKIRAHPDFVFILLQTYPNPEILYSQYIIPELVRSVSDSLQGQSPRSLEETRRMFKILIDAGFDLNHEDVQKCIVENTVTGNSKLLTLLIQEWINLRNGHYS